MASDDLDALVATFSGADRNLCTMTFRNNTSKVSVPPAERSWSGPQQPARTLTPWDWHRQRCPPSVSTTLPQAAVVQSVSTHGAIANAVILAPGDSYNERAFSTQPFRFVVNGELVAEVVCVGLHQRVEIADLDLSSQTVRIDMFVNCDSDAPPAPAGMPLHTNAKSLRHSPKRSLSIAHDTGGRALCNTWLNWDGEGVAYATNRISTYVGHPWAFTAREGALVLGVCVPRFHISMLTLHHAADPRGTAAIRAKLDSSGASGGGSAGAGASAGVGSSASAGAGAGAASGDSEAKGDDPKVRADVEAACTALQNATSADAASAALDALLAASEAGGTLPVKRVVVGLAQSARVSVGNNAWTDHVAAKFGGVLKLCP